MAVESVVEVSDNPSGKRVILIVDDESDIRELLQQILDSSGYETREARDGREAIDKVRCQKPDLITLDLAMPIIDGHEVLRHLARDPLTAQIPVVVVSACSSDLRPTEQVRRVVPKPFDINELLELIDDILLD